MEVPIQDPVAGTLLLAVLGLVLKSGVDIIRDLVRQRAVRTAMNGDAIHADLAARVLATERELTHRAKDAHDLRDVMNEHLMKIRERLARIEAKMGMP